MADAAWDQRKVRSGWLRRFQAGAADVWRTMRQGWESRVGRQFAIVTICCGTVLAVLMTVLQLVTDYRAERTAYHASMAKIERAILPSLAESLWVLDTVLVRSQLVGIAQIEGVTRAEVRGAGETFVVNATGSGPADAVVEMPVLRGQGTDAILLGQLIIHTSQAGIFRQIARRAGVVLAANLVSAICVAFVIMYVFQRLAGQHVQRLAAFADAYDPDVRGQRLRLAPTGVFVRRSHRCEFNALETAINRWMRTAEQRIEDLNHANREQAEFTYAISHDLKSPTNTMQMLIAELALAEHLGGEERDMLESLRQTNHRMGQLVEDVLDYSRLIEDAPDGTAVPLGPLIEDILSDLAADITAADARIECDALPVINGHPMQLRVLFQNLISNAIKFRKASKAPVVHIFAGAHAGGHRICVSDNGIGIPVRHRDQIFGLFKRLHTWPAFEGTGLGLTVCRRIMSNHGGTITVGDGIEGGTRFDLVFRT